MALQQIGVGAAGNDGTGDTVRAAFQKVNANSTALDALSLVKSNATGSDPTVNSDSAAGYSVGSTWTNTTTRTRWVCADNTATAAKWDAMDYADHPGYISGNWYPAVPNQTLANSSGLAVSTVYFFPFMVKAKITISDVAYRVNTLGSNALAGLFASDPTTRQPTGAPLGYTANMDVSGTGQKTASLNTNVTLEPGTLYWFGIMVDNAATVFQAPASSASWLGALLGNTTANISFLNSSSNSAGMTVSQPQTFASGISGFVAAPASQSTAAGSKACYLFYKVV